LSQILHEVRILAVNLSTDFPISLKILGAGLPIERIILAVGEP